MFAGGVFWQCRDDWRCVLAFFGFLRDTLRFAFLNIVTLFFECLLIGDRENILTSFCASGR